MDFDSKSTNDTVSPVIICKSEGESDETVPFDIYVDDTDDAMDVCIGGGTVETVEDKRRKPLKSCLKGGKGRRRKTRASVSFTPETKTHDGLFLLNGLVDKIVWAYFQGKIKCVMDVVKVVDIDMLHLLAKVYPKLTTVMRCCKKDGETHILPGGGGHGAKVTYKAHYKSLRRLREFVRVTHNHLHAGAVVATELGLDPDDASDFVLKYVAQKEAEVLKATQNVRPASASSSGRYLVACSS